MTAPTIRSVEDAHRERCVDFLHHADGTVTFKVYRKDPEDHGRWSLVADYSAIAYPDGEAAHRAARQHAPWLATAMPLP